MSSLLVGAWKAPAAMEHTTPRPGKESLCRAFEMK
jgi:hypothetical protein